jgi:hypothetical protein
MSEQVSEINVEVNELALSLLGWEVQDFRARATSTQYKTGGSCYHKLAISGVFRYNEADWTDCFSYSRDHPRHPVMLLSAPALSDKPSITALWTALSKKGTARVSDNDWFIPSYRPIDHSDLRVEITAYDSVEAHNRIAYIPLGVKEIPIEVEDETTFSSTRLTFDQMTAFTYGDDDDGDHAGKGLIRASGRVTFGSPEELLEDWVSTWRYEIRKPPTVQNKAPFARPVPNLAFDILDETGFLLEQGRGEIGISIPVNETGQTPSRNPTWLVDYGFQLRDFTAPPSRIIVRIEDN